MDASSSCRLCLYNCTTFDDLYSDTMQDAEMIQKIAKYLYIEIKENDEYTNSICNKCTEKIEDFHLFCCEVTANQEILLYSQPLEDDQSPIDEPNQQKTELVQVAQYSIKAENYIVTLQATAANNVASSINLSEFQPVSIPPIINLELSTNSNECSNVNLEIPYTTDILNPLENGADQEKIENTNPIVNIIETQKNENVICSQTFSKKVPKIRKSSRKKIAVKKSKVKVKEESSVVNETLSIEPELIKKTSDLTYQNDVELEKSTKSLNNDEILCDETNVIEEDDEDDCDESDASVDLSDEKPSNEIEKYDSDDSENDKFSGFPKILIKDTRLIIRGKTLLDLMSKFYRLECDLCMDSGKRSKFIFKNLTKLCVHYKKSHKIKGYVICCGMKLCKARGMAMHMSRHLQPEAFTCPKCDKIMTTPKILQYHIQNHLPENERPLPCPDCPRRFSYSSALIAHAISHLPEHLRASHICDECGKSFVSPGRLVSHMNGSHVVHGHDFICHICAKQFASRGNLSYHLTTHQHRTAHQVQCKECGKWLKNKICLRKHMNQHSEQRYKCSTCDYSCLNRQSLRNHVNVQHSDKKPFSCEICERTFKLKNTLINHMAQHTGLRRYACEFCKRTFASSGNYYSHRKRMHPQELATLLEKREEEDRLQRNKLRGSNAQAENFKVNAAV